MHFATLFASTLIVSAWFASSAFSNPITLAPHRAVYDLSLLRSSGPRGVESAKGRIAFTFLGNICEGYSLSFRQVTELQGSESGGLTADQNTATFEDGEGKTFRFRTQSSGGPEGVKTVQGVAERGTDGNLTVNRTAPERDSLTLTGGVMLPSTHMKQIIQAARDGRTNLSVKVFDGSEDGKTVYDSFAVIGRKATGPMIGQDSEVAQKAKLSDLPRWPVSISYFTSGDGERMPVYTISFELFDNGIARNLTLDYGDFALKGNLTSLEVMPIVACKP